MTPKGSNLHYVFHADYNLSAYFFWNFTIHFQNPCDYLNNYCTNTRFVCTHYGVFCMLNSNMALKIWISIFWENVWDFWPVVCLHSMCPTPYPSFTQISNYRIQRNNIHNKFKIMLVGNFILSFSPMIDGIIRLIPKLLRSSRYNHLQNITLKYKTSSILRLCSIPLSENFNKFTLY